MVWAWYGRKTENRPRTWRLLFCSQHHPTHFFPLWKCQSDQVSRNFIPKRPIYNKPELNQIIAWWREADKRLSEAVTVLYTDAYMRNLPRWVFGSITMFYTISRIFCVYVSWRQIDPYSVWNCPCFDLFWYHWSFCIGLWWPVVHFCASRLLLLAPSPGASEVTLLSVVQSRNPGTRL